jgi:hypothetical protein
MAGEIKATDLVDGIPQLTSDLKKLNDELENTVKIVTEGKKAFDSQSKSQSEVADKTERVKKATKQVSDIEKERISLERQMAKALDENAVANEELRLEVQKQKKANKELAKERLNLISAYQKESKRLRELKNRYKDLAISGQENTKEAKALKKELIELDGTLKDIEQSVGDNQRKVGAYAEALEGVPGPLNQVVSGIGNMTKAALKFIATPIGAILATIAGAVALVSKAFGRSEDRMNKVRVIGGKLSGVFNAFLKVLEPVTDFIVDKVIGAFEGLGKIFDKVVGGVSKGLRKLGFEKAAENVDNFAKKLDEAAKAGGRLVEEEAKLVKMQRLAEKTQLDFQKQAEKLRQIRDDEALSLGERMKANEELGKVLKTQLNEELKIANQALKVAEMRIELEGETTENLDERAEALTRISDIQERIVGQESEQLVNINALIKERIELEEKAYSATLERINAEIEANDKLNEELLKSEIELNEAQLELIEDDLTNYLEAQDKKLEAEQERINKEIELEEKKQEAIKQVKEAALQEAAQFASDLFAQQIDNELNKFKDSQIAKEEVLKAKLDKDLISEAQFEKQVADLRLKTRIEEAKAEKKKALFDIAVKTATAVVAQLSIPGAGIALAAAVAAIGAIQAATVAAKPLPKFKEGTKGKLSSDTVAIVGDGGKQELITTKEGGAFLSPATDTLVTLPKGSQVFSGNSPETKAAINGGMSADGYHQLINETKGLRSDIRSQRNESTIITDGGMKRVVKSANNSANYANKYLRHSV